jgi:hypothetical protein
MCYLNRHCEERSNPRCANQPCRLFTCPKEIASFLAMTILFTQFIVTSFEFLNSLMSDVITTSPGLTPSSIST